MASATAETPVSPPARVPAAPPTKKEEWAPRIWQGCDFFAWLRILVRNRFAVHPRYIYIAVVITLVSLFHTFMRFWQDALYGRRVRKTVIQHAPIFIIGHWRTGTTLLHEFMILDDRHAYPTTYECLDPNDFLLTEPTFTRLFRFLIPSRRPMDNMKAGFDRPQEDEFALCMLGAGSPYLDVLFPNRMPQYLEYLDLENVPASELQSWKDLFLLFLQRITFRSPKRLVLKSPPHTCRLRVLTEMFPDAVFVHIVRDPYVVFPSTMNLWKTFFRQQGLQKPTYAGLEEYVLGNFAHMYEQLEKTRHLVAPKRFYELRFEDLIEDPVGQMKALYEHLNLGAFEEYLPRLEAYLATIKGYETNRYALTAAQEAQITRRWGSVIEKYGYVMRGAV